MSDSYDPDRTISHSCDSERARSTLRDDYGLGDYFEADSGDKKAGDPVSPNTVVMTRLQFLLLSFFKKRSKSRL